MRRQLIEEPVVKRSVILEFQRAQRMRDALKRIRQSVRKVIHRVDVPFIAGILMRDMTYSVQRRVSHIDVRRGHVDLRTQDVRTILELASLHALEQVQVFFDGPATVRTVLARLGQCTAVLADFLGAQAVNIGLTHFDEFYGRLE